MTSLPGIVQLRHGGFFQSHLVVAFQPSFNALYQILLVLHPAGSPQNIKSLIPPPGVSKAKSACFRYFGA
jgi:hypothetical protein